MGFDNGFIQPHHLDATFDAFVTFKNVRDLSIALFGTYFVDPDRDPSLTSRYFAHFQLTLRSLELLTPTNNPKGLIASIAFFPSLERVFLEFYKLVEAEDSRFGELNSNRLNQFRGTLQMYNAGAGGKFILELTILQVQHHTLELSLDPEPSETELQALIAACAPTLRVLQLRQRMPFSDFW